VAIDACCNDESCSKESSYTTTIMQIVDICGEGADAPKCVYETDKASTSGNEGVVRACLQKSCAAKCFGNGRSHTKCDLENGGDSCSCTNAKESAGPACDNKTVAGTCVVTDTGCRCAAYGCSGASSCACKFGGSTGSSKTCRRGTNKGTCCLSVDYSGVQCKCDPDEDCRGTNEVSMSSCDEAEVLRVLGKGVVQSCSN
jgi:hypothetical protein